MPTGCYGADCDTGRAYAIEFLQTCDGTAGWASLLAQITADMIRAGTHGAFADGRQKVNGVVIGFMSTIGRALVHSRSYPVHAAQRGRLVHRRAASAH